MLRIWALADKSDTQLQIGLVAQLNSALDFGSSGCRFESCRAHKGKKAHPRGWAFLIFGRAKPVSARTGITESRGRLRSSFLFGIWSTKDHVSNPAGLFEFVDPQLFAEVFAIQRKCPLNIFICLSAKHTTVC